MLALVKIYAMIKYIPKNRNLLIFSMKFCRMPFSETIMIFCEMQVHFA